MSGLTSVTRSFVIPLEEITTPQECARIIDLLSKMSTYLQEMLEDEPLMEIAAKLPSIKQSGVFRDEFTVHAGRRHHSWTNITGNKAKYHRMNIERVRWILLSMKDRCDIARVCESYDWDAGCSGEIRADLTDADLYPTDGTIRNILRAGKMPTVPTECLSYLDYTNGDKQIVRQEYANRHITTHIECEGQWVTLDFDLPAHLRDFTGRFSKPIIRLEKDGTAAVQYAYDAKVLLQPRTEGLRLGVDAGRIKPFAASITDADGGYSSELTPSRELTRITRLIDVNTRDITRLHAKIDSIEKLLEGKPDAYLSRHLDDLVEERRCIRRSRTEKKDHAAHLVARDVVDHALREGAGVIHLEKLGWLDSRGGKWDHARVQQYICFLAELVDIDVYCVNASDTSHTDPFTDEHKDPSSDRLIDTVIGSLDRDYCASMEIGRRPAIKSRSKGAKKPKKTKKARAKRTLVPGKRRDKTGPTPRKPRPIIATLRRAQRDAPSSRDTQPSGASPAVASSGAARTPSTARPSVDRDRKDRSP